MPDPRSVMKEYRYLDEKRVVEGLTPEEDARYARLRDLVGPEVDGGGSPPRSGFDVNAAAAQLRESLLPAGLRNRPPPAPEAEPAEISAGDALASVYEEQVVEPAQPYEPDAASAPDAPPLDPNAPYDPNAQGGWDANQPWDPDAYATGAAAQPPPDPDAQLYDPNAQGGWDPNQPWDPAAVSAPAAEPYDPGAAFDPGAQAYDPGAQAYDPGAAFDPDAQPYDPGQEPAPLALDLDGGISLDPAGEAGFVPAGPVEPGFDASAEPGAEQAPLEADTSLPPAGWEVGPPAAEPALAGAPLGEYDADPAGLAPLGGPDGDGTGIAPLDAGGPEALPFDAAAESALPPGDVPEGYAAPLGEYDDTAGFGGEPYAATDLSAPLELDPAAAVPGEGGAWQPETALEEGFQLASEGSFGSGEAAYELAPPPEGERSAELDFSRPELSAEEPALVDGGAAPPPGADPLEVAVDVMAADPAFAPVAAEQTFEFDVDTVEELPTVEGADVLEEIPEESAAPPPRSLDFEPLVPHPAPAAPASAPLPEAIAPPPAVAPPFVVAGAHRVVVHTVEGQVRRGGLQDADLGAQSLSLTSQPEGATETIPTEKVKAIFFMLPPGEKPPSPDGKKVRVTFRDGRQVAGFSPDYDETGVGFFMIPGDTRTSTGRIWVYRSAVRQVVVS